MKKQKTKHLTCCVNPLDYPTERLQSEHLALLKCVNDKPMKWFAGIGEQPVKDRYYLAVSSGINNPFGIYCHEDPLFLAGILQEDNRSITCLLYSNFEIIDDPHGVMAKKTGFNWFLWNKLKWMEAKANMMDRQTFLYDESFLMENRFALIRYPDTSAASGDFIPGRQYLAITQEPDVSPCVYLHILLKRPDGKEKYSIGMFSKFDMLSDPLGLLDPWKTNWHENVRMQRQLRPDLYA